MSAGSVSEPALARAAPRPAALRDWRPWAALFAGCVLALAWARGVPFWPLLGLAIVALFGALRARFGRPAFGAEAALAVLSVGGLLGVVEMGLALLEPRYELREDEARVMAPPSEEEEARLAGVVWGTPAEPGTLRRPLPEALRRKMERMQGAPILPESWEKQRLPTVDGVRAYLWHGVLHLKDEDGLRRSAPFPPRDPSRLRVVALGDSLTNGKGIDSFWTYASQLERALGRDHDVEVFNLGRHGDQSQDVLETLRRWLPVLEPDVVIYGVCLNDFLPNDLQQTVGWTVPVPEFVKKFLTRNSRLGRLVDERFNDLLIRLGVRGNFYGMMMERLDEYGPRFGRDVAAMNRLVLDAGLPPVTALVLDQYPILDGLGRQLALDAEARMRAAGMRVIDSEPFYREMDGEDFRLARLEQHPNEEANVIWAAMFRDALVGLPTVAAHRRGGAGAR